MVLDFYLPKCHEMTRKQVKLNKTKKKRRRWQEDAEVTCGSSA